jgi:hypothetical protein
MRTRRRTYWRRRSDRLLLGAAIVAVLALFFTYTQGCNTTGESPTAPATTTATAAPSSTATASTPTVESTPAPTSGADIKIHKDGRVNNRTDTTYFACLYDKTYGEGQLAEEWKATPGVTKMSYVEPGCKPGTGQIDLILNPCPPTPHGLAPVAALPGINVPAQYAPDSPECTDDECVETEPTFIKIERGEEGDWGECEEVREGECARTRWYEEITTWKLCDTVWTTTKERPEYERCSCEQSDCVLKAELEGFACFAPLGSEESEASAFGVAAINGTLAWEKFDVDDSCWTVPKDSFVVMKDGRADCPEGETKYYAFTAEEGDYVCPQWTTVGRGSISHSTVFSCQ